MERTDTRNPFERYAAESSYGAYLDDTRTEIENRSSVTALDVTVAVVLQDIAQATRFADYLIALRDGAVYDWAPPVDVVTGEFLADVFAIEASVEHDGDGGPSVTPRRPLRDDLGT